MPRTGADVSVLILHLPGEPPRDVALRFIHGHGVWYVIGPQDPRPAWLDAIVGERTVRWWVGQQEFVGRARILDGVSEEAADVCTEARRTWGFAVYREWFGDAAIVAALIPDTGLPTSYYESLETLFDVSAQEYDRRLEANPIERVMRQTSLEILRSAFPTGGRLLELGCGTGAETIPLAEAGHDLVVVDLSTAMLDRLTLKAKARGVANRIQAVHARAGDLPGLTSSLGAASFDGAFSTFGAMNTEPNWGAMPDALARLLRPAAPLILGVWNRTCIAEMSLYALRGRPRRALARLEDPVPVGRSRYGVPVRAFAPKEFLGPFLPAFELERLIGLPVLLPPYDLWGRLTGLAPLLPPLSRADAAVRAHFPWNRLGDHFLAVLRRRSDAGESS